MALGILDLVGLAVALALATPMAVFGVSSLLAGDPLGAVFLALAAALLAVEHVLTTPDDLATRTVQRVAGRAAVDPETRDRE